MEQYGSCKFKHIKHVPKSFDNVEVLRLEDLGDIHYNAKDDVYICPECDEKAIASHIKEQVAQLVSELGEVN